MEKVRLLLIEGNRILRDGLMAAIKKQPDLEIVASWGKTGDAVPKARKLKPRVVLMNTSLEQNSLHLAEAFKKEVPQASVVVMDLSPTQKDLLEFVKAGASGFILKDATIDDFLKTIRLVAQNEKVLPPSLTSSLFSQIVERGFGMTKAEGGNSVTLTTREREVVGLIADGLSNKEIAQRLQVTAYTVKSHIHKILEKLDLRSRLEIANYVHTKGNTRSVRHLPVTGSVLRSIGQNDKKSKSF